MNALTPRGNGAQSRGLAEWRGHPMERLRREMDDLFDRFFGWPVFGDFDATRARPWGLDVTTRDNEMVVRAELPGFEPDELDVRVHGDALTIKAERNQEGERQRSYGRFEETIRIPAGVDPDKVRADYHNGILELRMPLPEAPQGKRITVHGAGGATAKAAGAEKATAKT